jgi:hypothetical protein
VVSALLAGWKFLLKKAALEFTGISIIWELLAEVHRQYSDLWRYNSHRSVILHLGRELEKHSIAQAMVEEKYTQPARMFDSRYQLWQT